MLLLSLCSVLCLIITCVDALHKDNAQPEQVALSLTKERNAMAVTWVTMQPVTGGISMVQFGLFDWQLNQTAMATTTVFVDEGPLGIIRYIHRATMRQLNSGRQYWYKVGSSYGWSHIFHFNVFHHGDDNQSFRICIYGDLGLVNGQSFGSLQNAAQRYQFDIVIHVGDIAYDISGDNGFTGDTFMRQMEPIAAYVPFMVIAGNHEAVNNYSHYVNRFTMPVDETDDNQYYSFDVGSVHFVGISTEYYGYFYQYGMQPTVTQYDWLRRDLQAANRRRDEIPWILSYMHRPFYCSNTNTEECGAFENTMVRTGYLTMPGLEPLFNEHGVDFSFWGHEHSYERLWPINDRVVYNQTDNPYHNAPAPVYIITGSAGCHSEHAWFSDSPGPWSAARNNDYGYTIVTVQNRTHVLIEQVSIELNDAIVDSQWISKTDGYRYHIDPERSKRPGIRVPGTPEPLDYAAVLRRVNKD